MFTQKKIIYIYFNKLDMSCLISRASTMCEKCVKLFGFESVELILVRVNIVINMQLSE